MKKLFEINSTEVTVSIKAYKELSPKKGWGIPEWEKLFISLRDAEYQPMENRLMCEAARLMLKWAGACSASLTLVTNETGFWVFVFKFEAVKDVLNFLTDAETIVSSPEFTK